MIDRLTHLDGVATPAVPVRSVPLYRCFWFYFAWPTVSEDLGAER